MEIQRIHHFLNEISPISKEALADFVQIIEPVILHKNDYLVREGSRVFRCFLLTEGVVRAFYSKKGIDYNTRFFTTGMFPIASSALLSEGLSPFTFQAVLPSKLIQFPYRDFINLCGKHQCLETLLQRIFAQLSVLQEKHESGLADNNITTNYQLFLQTYPGLEKLIPKMHVASYLGVSPIQLKRVQALMEKHMQP